MYTSKLKFYHQPLPTKPIHVTSLIMLALPLSMPRFKSVTFYQNSAKIKLFLQKNAKFLSAGSSARRPPKQPHPLQFLATRLLTYKRGLNLICK